MIPDPIVKSHTFTINERKIKFDAYEKEDTDYMFMPHTVLILCRKIFITDHSHPTGFKFEVIHACVGTRIFDLFDDMFPNHNTDYDYFMAYSGSSNEEIVEVLSHMKSISKR